jgi:glycosyltransferase involved in cell wall biosynthesis
VIEINILLDEDLYIVTSQIRVKLTAIILTFNESKHLKRCIHSIKDIADNVIIVDSFSTDETVSIARDHKIQFLQHKFINYSSQFNWALTQLETDTDWILRLDADEYLTPQLVEEIQSKLHAIPLEIDGIVCDRFMTFQGNLIRHGGVFPVRVIRLFRYGKGQCEVRWMDEHIKVDGGTTNFSGCLIDDNLNSLTWWTNKHNHYASREAVDLLNLEYKFMPCTSVANLQKLSQASIKRWFKEYIYIRLPLGFRSFAYFFYRYILCLGFLDGQSGTMFHFLQGFWYRYLVDSKVAEVKRYMNSKDVDLITAIEDILEIDVRANLIE